VKRAPRSALDKQHPKCALHHAPIYRTKFGRMYKGNCEEVLTKTPGLTRLKGKIQLIFTSPPFPLNKKKRYGNFKGKHYIKWLVSFASVFREYLAPRGSIVIELGNAWVAGSPVMSTLPIKALLRFLESANLNLCQEFICFNPAKLPSPAQWVTVERQRVKDAFTRTWWMSPSERPKASNRRVLAEYSPSMLRLLATRKYNSGTRPSEHRIGKTSFLKKYRGAIPPNVITASNTSSSDAYQKYCRQRGLTVHPARMPDKLAEFFVKFLTTKGDIVLDPFAGSNVTGSVAERLKRRWIAIEANAEYVEGSKGRFPSYRKWVVSRR
jgi:DNA modification methylase